MHKRNQPPTNATEDIVLTEIETIARQRIDERVSDARRSHPQPARHLLPRPAARTLRSLADSLAGDDG